MYYQQIVISVLDCPFCGGRAIPTKLKEDSMDNSGEIGVHCQVCGSWGKLYPFNEPVTEETDELVNAINAWNIRKES